MSVHSPRSGAPPRSSNTGKYSQRCSCLITSMSSPRQRKIATRGSETSPRRLSGGCDKNFKGAASEALALQLLSGNGRPDVLIDYCDRMSRCTTNGFTSRKILCAPVRRLAVSLRVQRSSPFVNCRAGASPAASVVERRKRVVEDVVGDVAALCDALDFVEPPMDTEVNAALAVFFFSLRQ